jgi:hypothetical protein
MEFTSFLATIFIFLICLMITFKPTEKVTILGAILIIPLLVFIIY